MASEAKLGGMDHDPKMWHGREAASQVVRRHSQANERGGVDAGLGIFMGVVFPCMSNILGVLLFLRLPWIVGKAGVLHSFLLVFVCCCCTFITTLSLSAVATNGKIRGGGSYFLISRSLGPALGAGVGLCFYMANSIGAAMYFMGTVEAWEIAAPGMQILGAGELNNIRVTGFCILAAALVIVAGGIKYVSKLGTCFLLIVLAVIVCMYLGSFVGPVQSDKYTIEVTGGDGHSAKLELVWGSPSSTYFSENWEPDYNQEQHAFPLDQAKYDFIRLMALWFPAVTGIMAGSNRSADLADPAGSIPKGTLFAQITTSIIYLSFVLLYGCIAPRTTLLDDKFFAASAAWPFKEVVIYGVMASTIGAGLTSLTSGTRLLSAIACDKTMPILSVFAATPGKEPRLALAASGILCACAIAIGELNAVAPLLTMFFLMCYTCVNMSCAVLEAVSDPNWRPTFRYHHWSISLAGVVLCVWMMFAISAILAFIAVIFCFAIFVYAAYNSHQVKWGDGFQGMKFQLARNILAHIDLQAHTKNWRPQLLVITEASLLCEDSEQPTDVLEIHEPELLTFASQLKGGNGITILGGICSGQGATELSNGGLFTCQKQRNNILDGQEAMKRLLQKYAIEGFGQVVYTNDYIEAMMSLVQVSGLGAFQPNCVLAAWPSNWNNRHAGEAARSNLIRLVQTAVVFQKVAIVTKGVSWPDMTQKLTGTCDIWWIVGDGGVLLLLPFLLKKNRVWHACRTRLFVLADEAGDDPEEMRTQLESFVRDFRLQIEFHVKVVNTSRELDAKDVILEAASCPEDTAHCSSSEEGHAKTVPQLVTNSDSTSGLKGPIISMEEADPDKFGPSLGVAPASTSHKKLSSEQIGNPRSCRPCGRMKTLGDVLARRPDREGSGGFVGTDRKRCRMKTTGTYRTMNSILSTSCEAFPNSPPGNIGTKPLMATGAASVSFDPYDNQDVANSAANTNQITACGSQDFLHFNSLSDPTFMQRASSCLRDDRNFIQSSAQLTSPIPCSTNELLLAHGLNSIIVTESCDADLVITNLPDMPSAESAYGYFELVEEMTKNLKRCVLVRGNGTEVITAFT